MGLLFICFWLICLVATFIGVAYLYKMLIPSDWGWKRIFCVHAIVTVILFIIAELWFSKEIWNEIDLNKDYSEPRSTLMDLLVNTEFWSSGAHILCATILGLSLLLGYKWIKE